MSAAELKTLPSGASDMAHIALTFDNNKLASALYGQFDENLARLEQKLGVDIRSRGQHAVVTGDMMHHALQCREPGWSTIFDTDKEQAAKSRRHFLGQVADTATLVLPIHFPSPTVGRASRSAPAASWLRPGPQRASTDPGGPPTRAAARRRARPRAAPRPRGRAARARRV